MDFDEKLDELFIDLPEPPPDLGPTMAATTIGKTLIVGGALPFSEGRIQYPGRVGIEVRLDNARFAARAAAIMALAIARRELGGTLGKIRRIVRVDGFVAASVDLKDHAKVIDGASELFGQVFGVYGKHVRSVVGVASLPQQACVELAVTFELK